MTRLMIMTFFGERRWTDDVHPHESPPVMTVPMMLLAVGSVGAGAFLVSGDRLVNWLEPVARTGAGDGAEGLRAAVLTVLTVLVALGGVRGGVVRLRPVGRCRRRAGRVSPLTVAARRHLYADAFNEAAFMRPGQWLDRFLVCFDNRGRRRRRERRGRRPRGGSGRLRRLQTGFVRSYALSMLGGSVPVVASLLAVRFS